MTISGTERKRSWESGLVGFGADLPPGRKSDPRNRSGRWDAFHLFVEHKPWSRRRASRAPVGCESRSPALISQAGGRCKPGNMQLLFIQQEAGLQLEPGDSAGFSATSRHTLQLSCVDCRSWKSKTVQNRSLGFPAFKGQPRNRHFPFGLNSLT